MGMVALTAYKPARCRRQQWQVAAAGGGGTSETRNVRCGDRPLSAARKAGRSHTRCARRRRAEAACGGTRQAAAKTVVDGAAAV